MWIALVGSKKVRANPIRRKLPVCLAHLTSFHEIALTSGKYDDLLFVTIFSCCFYGCYRSGELIVKNAKNEFDQWREVIKHHSLRFDGRWHSSPWLLVFNFGAFIFVIILQSATNYSGLIFACTIYRASPLLFLSFTLVAHLFPPPPLNSIRHLFF